MPKKEEACDDDEKLGLLDGLEFGDSGGRFSLSEYIQIGIEASILISLIFFSGLTMWQILSCVANVGLGLSPDALPPLQCSIFWFDPIPAPMVLIAIFALSGMIGASVFSLKWLYHSISKDMWNRDRFLWRISVPLVGAVLGVFVSFIFARTFGTAFSSTYVGLDTLLPACGFCFLVGIFADGVIASLENLARRIFGTLQDFH